MAPAALVLDRDLAETHYWLAHVYMSQRRFVAALEEAQRCQTDPPNPFSLSAVGACLAHLDRREEALKIVATLSQMAKTGLSRGARSHTYTSRWATWIRQLSLSPKAWTSESPFPHSSNSIPNSIPSEATRRSVSWFRVWGFDTPSGGGLRSAMGDFNARHGR